MANSHWSIDFWSEHSLRILHIARQYRPCLGGVERFVSDLAACLTGRGHHIEVATLDHCWRKPTRLSRHEIIDGIPVHRLPFVGGPLFFVSPGILKLVHQFDVIHIHNTDFFLDFLAATRFIHRCPLVVSTHGGFFHTPDHLTLKRLYFNAITRRSLKSAVVVPNSASDERRFGPYAHRAFRINNAIDYAAFAARPRQRVPGRIVTVGRLAPNKNLAGLLNAFALAHLTRPDLSLVVVGDGQLRTELERQAAMLKIVDAVRWAGEVNDAALCAELSEAEIFASAATYEAFGLALLEAMAAGVIPVANDIEAFRDVLVNEENGFLVDYARPAVAAQALIRALNLPNADSVRAAARATSARFNWSQAVEKFEAVYEEAIRRSS